jgi:LPXTG-site transpeptidase (sortase) family protein
MVALISVTDRGQCGWGASSETGLFGRFSCLTLSIIYFNGKEGKDMQSLQRKIVKNLYFLIVITIVLSLTTPVAAAQAPRPVTDQATGLLTTHFGVNLTLLAPHDGGSYNSFDWSSFQPTLNTGTVDFTEGDWYGDWSETDPNDFSTIQHATTPGTLDQDWYPSGAEWYDVEAMYFDNDANNIYVAIVTSVPFTVSNPDFGTIAGANATEVGVGDDRFNPGSGQPRYWIRPGDLALSLFDGTARSERYSSWHYNYGLDLVHENRNSDQSHPTGWGSVEMRDTNLGAGFYETNYDAGGSNITGVAGFDWYASTDSDGRVPAGWEHTNFDPASPDRGLVNYLGDASYVDYYEYTFPGGELENNARTYVVEATIPRSLFGANNPASGDAVGIRWVEGCRNDGNNTDNVLSLVGDIDDPFFSKSYDGTNQDFTTGLNVAIGEIVSYQVNVRVPATSTLNELTITDTLSEGLAFVDCGSITSPTTGIVVEPGLITNASAPGGFTCNPDETVPTDGNPAVFALGAGDANQGRQIVWRLGDVTNPDAVERTITIYYRAVVLDSLNNVRGVNTLRNQAVINWDETNSETVTTPALTVVEPWFDLIKTVDQSVVAPGGIVTFNLSLSHNTASNTNAYDLFLEDLVPDGLTYVPNSLDVIQGVPSTSENQNAGVSLLLPGVSGSPLLRVDWSQLLLGAATTVIEFQASLDAGTTSVTNSTAAAWTSLPGDVSAPQSAFNVLSRERNYDPGSNIDIYTVNDNITVRSGSGGGDGSSSESDDPGGLIVPAAGFAPDGMTLLPAQPIAQQYTVMGNVWLDVPAIDMQASIFGIPQAGQSWDLTWLKGDLGYLQGSAFPGWQGNTALVGHLTLADGTAGPFADLHALQIGDEITLHTWGDEGTYRVREVAYRVDAEDASVFQHEDEDWLTLITCQSYDSLTRAYRWRLVVRAERID